LIKTPILELFVSGIEAVPVRVCPFKLRTTGIEVGKDGYSRPTLSGIIQIRH
jgi:hypothetical protein